MRYPEKSTNFLAEEKKFLEKYIESKNLKESMEYAGIRKQRADSILARYTNYFKARLTVLGLTEDDVLLELKKLVVNPVDVKYDAIRGKHISIPDNKLRLSAIDTYLQLIGALTSGSNMAVQINVNNTEKETKIYFEMKDKPEFKALEALMLKSIDNMNNGAVDGEEENK
jgi:hypothetical protein